MYPVMRFVAVVTLLFVANFSHAIPGLVNYQGRLTGPTGQPITTTATVMFILWDAPTGGVESFSDLDEVLPDENGIYSTMIGDPGYEIPADEFATGSVWLGVYVFGVELLPRKQLTSAPYAFEAGHAVSADALGGTPASSYVTNVDLTSALAGTVPRRGSAYVIVEVTDSPTQNGANLKAAYDEGKTATPNGAPRTTTNRFTVFLPPARYDLGASALVVDYNDIDLVGLGPDPQMQTILRNDIVIQQTAGGPHFENLRIECTRNTGMLPLTDAATAAYFPEDYMSDTKIRNCHFVSDGLHAWSMRVCTPYGGTYERCKATGNYAFGGGVGGDATGTFIDCEAGEHSFGISANGNFTRCKGGANSFAGEGGTFSGTMTHCTNQGAWVGTMNGKVTDSYFGAGSTLTLMSSARIINSTIAGSVDFNSVAAGMCHSRAQNIVNDASNAFGINNAAAMNVEDGDVQ